ncbi:MAG: winged helix-turn-helix domain-containing protein [Halobacteriales archaeon]|nr:winged helix-turn-helix domain-containing protein [Halobacteriales archaeon]
MSDEKELWDEVGHLKGGKHRYEVFIHLAQHGAAIPSELSEETDRSIQRVHDALKELEEAEIVELKVPEERKKGRIYGLTDRGNSVWQFMIKQDIEEK